MGASRGRADAQEGGGVANALPPKKRTLQKDIREFGKPIVKERANAGAGRRGTADEPVDCEVVESGESDVLQGERGDNEIVAGHGERRTRRRRRTVQVSDSDDDEGTERPGKRGRLRKTVAHDETGGAVHGRRDGEVGENEGARWPGDGAGGVNRSRSRSRDRTDSGNVVARERTRSVDAPEPDAAEKRVTAGPGLRKGDPRDRGPG